MKDENKKNSKTKKDTSVKKSKAVSDTPVKKNKKTVTKKTINKKVDEPSSILNTKIITDDFEETKKVKYNNIAVISLLFVLSIIFLVFLTNKTFFRNSYRNGNFNIKLPLFVYYVDDSENVLTLKTLRKSEYMNKYFDEYLSNLENFSFYKCNNGKTVYYNEENKIAIYDIEITKNIAIKTIKIKYDVIPTDKVCK